jgi:hypothetical protein
MEQAMPTKPISTSLIGGILSGIVGLLVFLTIHHFWIGPIWFIMPAGLLIAGLGGLAVGWAYGEIRAGLPPRPWTSLSMFGLMAAILAPAVILAQILPPVVDVAAGKLVGTTGELIVRFVLELLLTATTVGMLAGWLLARTWRGAVAMAVAGLAFALGPGHNIPILGNTPVAGKGLILLAAIALASSVVLVETDEWLARRWLKTLSGARQVTDTLDLS